jgi:soluble cytochrome b562
MERLVIAIKKKIKEYDTDLGKNLLSRSVDKIEDFKKIQGMSEGLNRALEIIDETTQKYKEGDIDD